MIELITAQSILPNSSTSEDKISLIELCYCRGYYKLYSLLTPHMLQQIYFLTIHNFMNSINDLKTNSSTV